jgi:hypothetical protein
LTKIGAEKLEQKFFSMVGSTKTEREAYEQYLITKGGGVRNLINEKNPMDGRMDEFNEIIESVITLIYRGKNMNTSVELSIDDTFLIYKQEYSPAFVKETIEKKHLKGLHIFSILKDQSLPNLDFLKDFSFLRALTICTSKDHDMSFLKSMLNLEYLSIVTTGNSIVDIGSMKSLSWFSIEWRKDKVIGFESCHNLIDLGLIDFTEKDFYLLDKVPQLEALTVKTSNIESTQGLQSCRSLSYLLLANCKKLKSISSISNHVNLKSLWIESCKKITDFHELKNLPSLEKLLIIDCGEIPSLSFLKEMPSLKELRIVGKTRILDGDLSLTQGIQTVVLP